MKRRLSMKKEIKLAQRALELAMLISTETTTDAWFEYHGHCNIVDARYAPDGWLLWKDKDGNNQSNSVYIAACDSPTVKNLQYIVDCFEFIYAVAERK